MVVAAPAARADDAPTPPKLDLSRTNDQPVYPEGAVARKEQGNTVLAIEINARGGLTKITVDTTSGFDDLDQAAVSAAREWRYEAASDGHKDVPGVLKLTVHFQLSPLPKTQISESEVYALADIGDMIVCRREAAAIGSNMAPPKVCRTKRDWDAIAEQSKHRTTPLMRGDVNPGHRPGF
jgi:protein TonB